MTSVLIPTKLSSQQTVRDATSNTGHPVMFELHQFVRWKQSERALKLLRKHSQSHLPINMTVNQESVLHLAAQNNDEVLLNYLIQQYKNDININVKDFSGLTPLHMACAQGNQKTVYILLKHGALPNVQCDRQKQTPAHMAAEIGSVPVLRLLKKFSARLDKKNVFGNRPIHRAAYHNHYKALTFLLQEAKCDPSSRNIDGQSPLYMAIVQGCDESNMDSIMGLVGKFNADVESPVSSNHDRTMLHISIHEKKYAIAQYLVHHQADVNAVDSSGWSALHYSCQTPDNDLVQLLLKNDADVHIRTHIELYTPLHLSAIQGNLNMMDMLIKNGADVNALSQQNQTPLHLACLHDHSDCVRVLLQNKAKRFVKDLKGKAPLDLASNDNVRNVFNEQIRWPSHLTVQIPEKVHQRLPMHDGSPRMEMNLFPKEMMSRSKSSKKQSSELFNKLPNSPLAAHQGKKSKQSGNGLLSTALQVNLFSKDKKNRENTASGKLAMKKHEEKRNDTLKQLEQMIVHQQNMNPNIDVGYYHDYLTKIKKQTEKQRKKQERRQAKSRSDTWDPYFAFASEKQLKGTKMEKLKKKRRSIR